MYSKAFKIVTRTANRLLFGLELKPEVLELALQYSDTFFMGANIVRHYPEWLKPLVVRYKTGIIQQKKIAKQHLGPVIEKRTKAMEEAHKNGTYAEF